MSQFVPSVDFLRTYRANRLNALVTGAPVPWFTTPCDDIKEVVDTFSTDKDNAEWNVLATTAKTESISRLKMQACRIKIAFLAGFRQDVISQFSSLPGTAGAYVPRTSVDSPCDSIEDIASAKYNTAGFEQLVAAAETKAAGTK